MTAIYNEVVLTTTATFDTEVKTGSERRPWFEAHGERHPILVAESDGGVVGWASLSRWSERPAYDDTAETSFYVKAEYRGRGIGRASLKGRSSRWSAAAGVPYAHRPRRRGERGEPPPQ